MRNKIPKTLYRNKRPKILLWKRQLILQSETNNQISNTKLKIVVAVSKFSIKVTVRKIENKMLVLKYIALRPISIPIPANEDAARKVASKFSSAESNNWNYNAKQITKLAIRNSELQYKNSRYQYIWGNLRLKWYWWNRQQKSHFR